MELWKSKKNMAFIVYLLSCVVNTQFSFPYLFIGLAIGVFFCLCSYLQ